MTSAAPAGRSRAPIRMLWVAFLAILMSGPVLTRRGFVLIGDMVFTPHQPWKAAWYGGDGGVPRAVPGDAIVSLVTLGIPGDLLQAIVLLGVPALAGAGVVALTRSWRTAPALAATTCYVWSPYVDERWGIGHWALLLGYSALPWTVLAVQRLALGRPGGVALLWVSIGLAAAFSPTGGALAATVAVALALAHRSRLLLVTVTAVVLNLPWALPALLAGQGLPADPLGAIAFAARADTPWGLWGSLIGGGGIWKSSVVSPVRMHPVLSGLALLVAAAGAWGAWRPAAGAVERRTLRALLAAGAMLLLLVGLLASPAGRPLAEFLVVRVPGGGLLRDGQKWLAPWCLAVALGWGSCWQRWSPALSVRGLGWLAVAAMTLPLLTLPSLAWGRAGDWQPVAYPREWTQVAELLETHGRADDRVLSLPFTVYRRYAWNAQRAGLDPAPRFFTGRFLTDDQLGLTGGRAVAGESRDAARVRSVADRPELLAATLGELGIRWVLIQHGTPGPGALPANLGTVRHTGPELTLVDLGPHALPPSRAETPGDTPTTAAYARPLLLLDAALAILVLGALGQCSYLAWARSRSRSGASRQPS